MRDIFQLRENSGHYQDSNQFFLSAAFALEFVKYRMSPGQNFIKRLQEKNIADLLEE